MGCRYWEMQVGRCYGYNSCKCAAMTRASRTSCPYQVAIERAEGNAKDLGGLRYPNSTTIVELARYARQPMRFVRVMVALKPSDLNAALALARDLHASPHPTHRQCAEMLFCWCTRQLVADIDKRGTGHA